MNVAARCPTAAALARRQLLFASQQRYTSSSSSSVGSSSNSKASGASAGRGGSTSTSGSTSSTTLPRPNLPISRLVAAARSGELLHRVTSRRAFPSEEQASSAVRELVRASDELADVRHKVDSLRRERNSLSSSSSRTPRADELASRKRAKEVKQELKALEQELRALESSVHDLADSFPNESHRLAPVGSEDLARVARYVHFQPRTNQQGGDVPPAEPARDHLNISAMLSSKEHHQHLQVSSVDMRAGSLISGSSWPVMSGLIARLSHALAQYALSRACAHGFMPTVVPDVVRAELAHRTGFKPRDDGAGASQTYFVDAGHATATRDDPQQVVLAGTAEIPLVGLLAGQTLSADAGGDGAVRLVALANAFRAEAGARGADTRGLYRVHQFSKVELVVACDPSRSDSELERLVCVQTDILSGLGLPIRVLDMPTEELGASACRKFDIEAWMPGRGKWGELSSASNCTDYQARRLGIRFRGAAPSSPPPSSARSRPPLEDLDIPVPAALEATALYPELQSEVQASGARSSSEYAHTLNATAGAIPRLIIAVLENGAVFSGANEEQGLDKLRLPRALKPFWLLAGDEQLIEWTEEVGEPLRADWDWSRSQ